MDEFSSYCHIEWGKVENNPIYFPLITRLLTFSTYYDINGDNMEKQPVIKANLKFTTSISGRTNHWLKE